MEDRSVYDRLQQDEIRLLEVLPIAPNNEEPCLSIEVHTRGDAPAYAAMSYTWGDDHESRYITLSGRRFPSRPNLYDMLIDMRGYHMSKMPEIRYLWIDAISINQQDTAEKNIQVARMEETYRKAAVVVVWLGRPENLDQALDSREDDSIRLSSPKFVDELVARPYWSRMWIVQELVLASSLLFTFGHMRFKWTDLVGPLNVWATFGKSKWRHSAAISVIKLARSGKHISKQGYALGELMRQMEFQQCGNPLDRIFALLSLVEHEERDVLSKVFPNYDLDHEKVVLMTMVYLKQIYAPAPFKWAIKPESFWSASVFGLDKATCARLWAETERYEIAHDLSNYLKVWNIKGIGKLLHVGNMAQILQEQKSQLKENRVEWLETRVNVLRNIAAG